MLDLLGSFTCSTGVLLVADPCYAREGASRGGPVARVEGAARGRWDVWLERVDDPELSGAPQIRGLIAGSAPFAGGSAPAWRTIERALCFDSAQVGIFDAAFFGAKLRAVDTELAAAILGPVGAGVVPHGGEESVSWQRSGVGPRRTARLSLQRPSTARVRTPPIQTTSPSTMSPRNFSHASELSKGQHTCAPSERRSSTADRATVSAAVGGARTTFTTSPRPVQHSTTPISSTAQ